MGWDVGCPQEVRQQIRQTLLRRNAETCEWRFYERVRVDLITGCWIWDGAVTSQRRYGALMVGRKMLYAHRYSYQLHKGQIPDGLTIDHLCRVTRCVNPEHLEAVTNSENVKREAAALRRTACPRGHPYDAENTKFYNGNRYCRECNRARALKNYRDRREKIATP